MDSGEKRLHELGYKQELRRSLSYANFLQTLQPHFVQVVQLRRFSQTKFPNIRAVLLGVLVFVEASPTSR